MVLMNLLKQFASDRSGAVTLDWVALTAGVVVISIGITYSVFTGGDASIDTMILNFNVELTRAGDNLEGQVASFGDPFE